MLHDTAEHLQSLLTTYNLKPRSNRQWGQHFLIDDAVLADIIIASHINPGETILEIGPGPGVLTRALLTAGAHVVAIEQDRRFEPLLQKEFSGKQFSLTLGNALTVDWSALGLADHSFAIVANLPYSITTPLMEKMLEKPGPTRAILMMQRDVAERIAAGPGDSQRGALSVILQRQYMIEMVRAVPRKAFTPPPAVESAVVRLLPRAQPAADGFNAFVKVSFRHRRKVVCNSLQKIYPSVSIMNCFEQLHIEKHSRPQDLSNEQWGVLFDFLK